MVKRIHGGGYTVETYTRRDIHTEGTYTRRDVHTDGIYTRWNHIHGEWYRVECIVHMVERTHGEVYTRWSVNAVKCTHGGVHTEECTRGGVYARW